MRLKRWCWRPCDYCSIGLSKLACWFKAISIELRMPARQWFDWKSWQNMPLERSTEIDVMNGEAIKIVAYGSIKKSLWLRRSFVGIHRIEHSTYQMLLAKDQCCTFVVCSVMAGLSSIMHPVSSILTLLTLIRACPVKETCW